jgi:RimJ/RimL family protein N-acetyltransferase
VDVAPPDRPLTDGVVTLRPWTLDDVPALIVGIDGDPEISSFLELIPQPYRTNEGRAWVELATAMWRDQSGSPFAVVVDDAVVGGAGISWIDREHGVGDIGYWIRSDARGRGHTTRAVRVLSHWAFGCGCQRLQVRADTENVASQRVAERAGFQKEGVMRSVRFNARLNRRMDFVLFSMLPGELD